MLWSMIIQGMALVSGILQRMVNVNFHFSKSNIYEGGDGQWGITEFGYDLSDKGIAIIDSLATIIHYGLDFAAQFSTLLPAIASNTYNTQVATSFQITPP